MENKEIRNYIKEISENAVLLDNPYFDNSIIGIDELTNAVVYDLEKMIEEFMSDEKCSYEEASEFIDYNTLRAIPYSKSLLGEDAIPPIVMGYSSVLSSFKEGDDL